MSSRSFGQARDLAWQRVTRPAALAFAVLLLLGLLLALAPDGLTVETLQPAESAHGPEDWGWSIQAAPGWVVLFFLGDTLFALAFGWTFLRLWKAVPGGPMAGVAIGAALLKAGADVLENLLHLQPAIEALLTGTFALPPVGALVALAMVKRAAASVAGLAFAFALPGESGAAKVARLLLAALGLSAALGFFVPALRLAHATLLFLFLAYLLWYRRRAADELY